MSFELKITFKDGSIQSSNFKTMEELNAYPLESLFGAPITTTIIPERQVVDIDESTISHPAVLDENGNVVTPSFDEVVPATYKIIPEEIITTINYTVEVIDNSFQDEINSLISSGDADEIVCRKCWSLVGGYNKKRVLTTEQIMSQISTFSNVDYALSKKMPTTAKYFINQITPDGVAVTQELKDMLLHILKEY